MGSNQVQPVSGEITIRQRQLNLIYVTGYTTSLYAVHFKRALNSGEPHRSFIFLKVADFKGVRAG